MPDEQSASAMTAVSMVFLGALLTALRLYDNIAKLVVRVPRAITGFANAGACNGFKSEGIVTGLCTKMFTIADR